MGKHDYLTLSSLFGETSCDRFAVEVVQRRDGIVEDDPGLAVIGRKLGEEACKRDAAVLAFAKDGPGVRRLLVDQAYLEPRDAALRACLIKFDRQPAEVEMVSRSSTFIGNGV